LISAVAQKIGTVYRGILIGGLLTETFSSRAIDHGVRLLTATVCHATAADDPVTSSVSREIGVADPGIENDPRETTALDHFCPLYVVLGTDLCLCCLIATVNVAKFAPLGVN
jgi:hypothetical protein